MDDVQLALESVVVGCIRTRPDEQLPAHRGGFACDSPDLFGTDGDVAPAERRLAFALDAGHEQLLELCSSARVLRQEADGNAVPASLRELDAAHGAQQTVWHLRA